MVHDNRKHDWSQCYWSFQGFFSRELNIFHVNQSVRHTAYNFLGFKIRKRTLSLPRSHPWPLKLWSPEGWRGSKSSCYAVCKLLFVKPQNHLCVTKNLLIHRCSVFEEKIKMSAPNPQQQRFWHHKSPGHWVTSTVVAIILRGAGHFQQSFNRGNKC